MRFNPVDFLASQGILPAGQRPRLARLTGGYWNAVYRLRAPGLDWVVKVYYEGDSPSLFPVLPQAEALALRCLSGQAIAPEPVAFLPAGKAPAVLVYQFVAGPLWQTGVAAVAALLRRLHALPASGWDGFRLLPVTPAGILAQGDALLDRARPDSLAGHLRRLRPSQRQGPPPGERVLVHTDVGPGNLVVAADGLRLIDWQCPGLGDPAEDVWTFLSPAFQILFDHAPLSPAEGEAFLAAYGQAAVAGRLAFLGPAFAYRMAAHCVVRRQALAGSNPAASAAYERAFAAQVAVLEEE